MQRLCIILVTASCWWAIALALTLTACSSSNGGEGGGGGVGGSGGSGGDSTAMPSTGSGGSRAATEDSGAAGQTTTPDPSRDAGTPVTDDGSVGPSNTDDAGEGSTPVQPSGMEGGAPDVVVNIPRTTEAMLSAQSAGCLSCAQTNGCLDPLQMGGTCEMVTGNADGGGSEAALCLKTLYDIFTSKCDSELLLTNCLCGQTDQSDCLTGVAPPAGPAYADYVSDFGTGIDSINLYWDTPTFGAGQANSILECVTYFGCGCVGEPTQ